MLNESVFKIVFFISKNKVGGTSFKDEALKAITTKGQV